MEWILWFFIVCIVEIGSIVIHFIRLWVKLIIVIANIVIVITVNGTNIIISLIMIECFHEITVDIL